jgi:hypothetical protein
MEQSFAKSDYVTLIFEGANTSLYPGFDIKDGELTYVRNMDSHKSPTILSVRPGRAAYASPVTKPNAFGARDNSSLHVLDGGVWKRWDGSAWQTVASGLTDAAGKIFDIKTADKTLTVLINGTDKKYWDGTTVTDMAAAPASKLCVGHRYRLYYATKNAVQASDLSDFTTYPADCILLVTNAKGDLIALNKYNDHVVVYSPFSFHEVYGDSAEDWDVVDVASVGTLSDRCVVEHASLLWWLDINGAVYKYGGGKPVLVPDKVGNEYLKEINLDYKHLCCAGAHKNSIFWSIPVKPSTTNNLIAEYRSDLDRWYFHTGNIVQFAKIGDQLLGVAGDGKIYNMESGLDDVGTPIAWKCRTKPFQDMSLTAKKSVRELIIVADVPSGSTFNVSGSKEAIGETFESLYSFTPASDIQKAKILIPTNKLQLADWYRLQFDGSGPCDIYYLYKAVGKRGGNF